MTYQIDQAPRRRLAAALANGASAIALAAGFLAVTAVTARADTTINATTGSDVATAVTDANAGQTVVVNVASGVTVDLSTTTLPDYTTAGGSLSFGSATTGGFAGNLSGGSLDFTQPLIIAVGPSPTISTNLSGSGALEISGNTAVNRNQLFFVTPTLTLSGANTFTGGLDWMTSGGGIDPVQVVFATPSSVPATGGFGGGFDAVAAGYPINQAFIANFQPTAGIVVAALAADSSNPLNFSTLSNEIELGAVDGVHTYSGALTPSALSVYNFGGGNGELIVASNLGDVVTPANSTSVVVQGQAGGAGLTAGFTDLTGTNTYSRGTEIFGGILEFGVPSALPGAGAVTLLSVNPTVAFGYAFDQTALGRIVNNATFATVALGVDNSNPLNFSTAAAGLSLGAIGDVTYSGVLTPGAVGYLLGGGEGALTVSSALTGAAGLTINQAYSFGGQQGAGRGDGGPVPSVVLTNTDTYTGATTIDWGVLQLGNGTTNGLITGSSGVTTASFKNNSSILAFDEATPVTFAVPISGAVAIEQDGPGEVTLAAPDTSDGVVYIKAGTLAIGAGGSINSGGFGQVLIANGATLDISTGGNQSVPAVEGGAGASVTLGANTLTLESAQNAQPTFYAGQLPIAATAGLTINDFGGVISGSGGVVIAGAQTFSGINTYGGGTTVNGGLTLGDGVNAGQAGPGPIAGSGALVFNEPAPVTVANPIGGALTVTQIGPGAVVLTGANTYSGATEVGNFNLNATLQLGDGVLTGTLGNGAGKVIVSGALVFDEGGPVTVTNVISDFNASQAGAVTQNGPGTVTLDGVNTYTGLTEVAGGALDIGDAAATTAQVGGSVQVDAAGALGGFGTIGGNLVNNGLVQPSRLTAEGTFSQAAGGDLLIGVTPSTIDTLTIEGTANLAGTVTFAYAPGTYAARTYTFLTSAGLGGTQFTTVAASTSQPTPAGFAQSVTYTITNANLVLAAASPPPPPVSPPPPPPPPPVSPPPPPPPPPVSPPPPPVTVAPRDPTLFSAQDFAFAENDAAFVTSVLGRTLANGGGDTFYNLGASGGPDARGWIDVEGSVQHTATRAVAPGSRATSGGVEAGADVDVAPGGRIGAALAYESVDFSDADASRANQSALMLSLYGSQTLGNVGFSVALSYANGWDDTDRASGFGFSAASRRTSELAAGFQAATALETGGVTLTPAVGVLIAQQTGTAFTEINELAPAFAVSGAPQRASFFSPYATLGFSHAHTDASGLTVTPDLQLGYRYDAAAVGERVALVASDGTVFAGNQIGLGRSSAVLGAGVTVHRGVWTAFVRYQASAAGDWSWQSLEGGVRLAF